MSEVNYFKKLEEKWASDAANKIASNETDDAIKEPEKSFQSKSEEVAREIGFASRLLIQATLPHSKPDPGVHEFQRSNGFVTLKVTADSAHGLPYGTYPRLLLAWVTTEAVRTKSPEIELGDSLREFVSKLGLAYGGGSRGAGPRLREHMGRLFTSTVSATVRRDGEWHNLGFRPVEKINMFWDCKNPNQYSLWHSAIRLNYTFFEEIARQPVPLDMDALRTLSKSRSPLALDIYQWLTHRMSYLRTPVTVPWKSLEMQFGGDYARLRMFKDRFLGQLKLVLKLYPQAKVEAVPSGLILRPSKTHVPMRLLRTARK